MARKDKYKKKQIDWSPTKGTHYSKKQDIPEISGKGLRTVEAVEREQKKKSTKLFDEYKEKYKPSEDKARREALESISKKNRGYTKRPKRSK